MPIVPYSLYHFGGSQVTRNPSDQGSEPQFRTPEKGALEKKPAGDAGNGPETVLVVDDEEMVIEVIEDLFQLLGYRVLKAESGKEALEVYEENKEEIDMVVLDMIMPGMGGGEIYDRMKALNPQVKVLLSSGYTLDGQAAEILNRGCNGFIQKPFKIRELSEKLRDILAEK
jgi:two-component system cell cycle sensor histidine kinase/response regulator CckA